MVVHAANLHDTKSGILPARKAFEKDPSIQRFCADAGYRKTFEQDISRESGLTIPDVFPKALKFLLILPKPYALFRLFTLLKRF